MLTEVIQVCLLRLNKRRISNKLTLAKIIVLGQSVDKLLKFKLVTFDADNARNCELILHLIVTFERVCQVKVVMWCDK